MFHHKAAAKLGDPISQLKYGEICLDENLITEAIEMFEKAASQNYREGDYVMSLILFSKEIPGHNALLAIKRMLKVATAGEDHSIIAFNWESGPLDFRGKVYDKEQLDELLDGFSKAEQDEVYDYLKLNDYSPLEDFGILDEENYVYSKEKYKSFTVISISNITKKSQRVDFILEATDDIQEFLLKIFLKYDCKNVRSVIINNEALVGSFICDDCEFETGSSVVFTERAVILMEENADELKEILVYENNGEPVSIAKFPTEH